MLRPYYKIGNSGYSGKWISNHLFGYKHTEFTILEGENPYLAFYGFVVIGLFGYNYSISKNPIKFLLYTRIIGPIKMWWYLRNQKRLQKIHTDYLKSFNRRQKL